MTAATPTTIGDRLRAAREKAGISQAQLAERIGCDRQSIYRYETGRMSPSAEVLAAICGSLRASADRVLGLRD